MIRNTQSDYMKIGISFDGSDIFNYTIPKTEWVRVKNAYIDKERCFKFSDPRAYVGNAEYIDMGAVKRIILY